MLSACFVLAHKRQRDASEKRQPWPQALDAWSTLCDCAGALVLSQIPKDRGCRNRSRRGKATQSCTAKGAPHEKESDDRSRIHRGGEALGRYHVQLSEGHRLDRLYTYALTLVTTLRKQEVGGTTARWTRRSSDYNRRSKCCFVFVALRKKIMATPKGHERSRTATATAMATEGDMGCDHRGSSSEGHRGSSFRHVGEKLSLDNENKRGNHS
ncbi:hypothetical protein BHE74_00054714 [Ensete ventricosum]|nr:hypothetical protein BHE74_00054714 [Ensete ventricosum]